MKIRGIKPEFWTSDQAGEVSRDARLLWVGLWAMSCDNGHCPDRPKVIKNSVFPGDIDISHVDVSAWVDELADAGLVTRADGVITTPNLGKHQKVDRRYFKGCDLVEGCAEESDEIKRANQATKKPQVKRLKVAAP